MFIPLVRSLFRHELSNLGVMCERDRGKKCTSKEKQSSDSGTHGRIPKTAPPIPSIVLIALENFLDSEADMRKKNLVGFILFLVYTWSTCRDALEIKVEPLVDGAGDSGGLLETKASKTKGAQGSKNARMGLPAVGPRYSLTSRQWAAASRRSGREYGEMRVRMGR